MKEEFRALLPRALAADGNKNTERGLMGTFPGPVQFFWVWVHTRVPEGPPAWDGPVLSPSYSEINFLWIDVLFPSYLAPL